MSGGLIVKSETQRIVVSSQQRIEVEDRTINVLNRPVSVTVIPAGPQGPPGVEGPPGIDADELLLDHVVDPEPHPAYDDIPNLVIHFENGLF